MAKAKKQVNFEDALWGACDKLRGTVEPAEYKHVVLSLIFLKFVNDKFDFRRAELVAEGKEKYIGGGEESFGFLPYDKVRDKDSPASICLICEIAAWAKDNGMQWFLRAFKDKDFLNAL